MINPFVLLVADLLDRTFGELPENMHPVVMIGNIIYKIQKIIPSSNSKNPKMDLIKGIILNLSVIFILLIIVSIVDYLLNFLPSFLKLVGQSIVISTVIGHKSLIEFSKSPLEYLKNNDFENARKSVQHIVSRKTAELDESHIISAGIESASENITDSIIAPLFYTIFFGIYGAVIYRAINTMDAMLGYKNEKYNYYGRFSAYLDDIANFIPSRIAGLILAISAPFYGGSILKGLKGYFYQGNKTPSPNSGYTMAVLANSLDMQLEKIGYYKLGQGEITLKKGYQSLKAIDCTTFGFLIIYGLIYGILFMK
ncbi:adenosylcobinamide-phosphate synthase CbiB [Methanococcus voltae]|uniref:Probable cobalamin biosynthesis protein CobD n=1 Tax=Methanococcus voltae (strain ATCC BAA-1334 / A3) TaxID=456320 RepID=D7DS84_METV3|nr:adenosylcobinamide-phosphate synthase CbiB [Methanococcus voltae]MCS3901520.1 adenosylcobinamide-phosphate synthase [Methanococcus voltae]